jgi:hypothetical protein
LNLSFEQLENKQNPVYVARKSRGVEKKELAEFYKKVQIISNRPQ